MKKDFEIIGCGSVLIDELSVLPKYPSADEKIEVIKTQKQLGGPVPTALRALAKLGLLNTAFIGKIGDDDKGAFIKRELCKSNVESSLLIQEINATSGHSNVWIDNITGTRTIAYTSGTLTPITSLDLQTLPTAKFLHLDGREPEAAYSLIKKYKETNTYISIDTGNFRESTLKLIPLCDIVIMPKRFAIAMFGENPMKVLLSKIKDKYKEPSLYIITDGVNGSVASYKNETITQNAFSINVVDTTGAGDVHSAGIIYGLYNNWEINETLEFAAALAAIKCKHLGNLILPEFDEVLTFLDSQKALSL